MYKDDVLSSRNVRNDICDNTINFLNAYENIKKNVEKKSLKLKNLRNHSPYICSKLSI